MPSGLSICGTTGTCCSNHVLVALKVVSSASLSLQIEVHLEKLFQENVKEEKGIHLANLCRVICHEIQIFKIVLELVLNFGGEQEKANSLHKLPTAVLWRSRLDNVL
jgi:hypothetical protein